MVVFIDHFNTIFVLDLQVFLAISFNYTGGQNTSKPTSGEQKQTNELKLS